MDPKDRFDWLRAADEEIRRELGGYAPKPPSYPLPGSDVKDLREQVLAWARTWIPLQSENLAKAAIFSENGFPTPLGVTKELLDTTVRMFQELSSIIEEGPR